MLLAGVVGGVGPARSGEYLGDSWKRGGSRSPAFVPGVVGPWGQPVPMAAPYSSDPPSGAKLAAQMLGNSMPLDAVQQASFDMPGMPSALTPPGVPVSPGLPTPGGNLMPAGGMGAGGYGPLAPPGAMPPGPGMPLTMGGPRYPGAVAAIGALTGHPGQPFPVSRTEVFFTGPLDMKVAWFAPGPDGRPQFTPQTLDVPARYNFLQAAIYRLKLTGIPGRPGLELYPTLEVVPANPKTTAFLAHSAVPLTITDDDLDQVQAGNYLVKVIYLPDPQFQDLAVTGPSEVVSSRLDPGVDPIAEACRRGSILLVLRMGNIHLELPHTPPMDAPGPLGPFGNRGPQGGGMAPGTATAGPGQGGPAMPPLGPGGPMMGPMMPGGPFGAPGAQQGPQFGPQFGPQSLPSPTFTPNSPTGRLPQSGLLQSVKFQTTGRPTELPTATGGR